MSTTHMSKGKRLKVGSQRTWGFQAMGTLWGPSTWASQFWSLVRTECLSSCPNLGHVLFSEGSSQPTVEEEAFLRELEPPLLGETGIDAVYTTCIFQNLPLA